ncbi:Hypothetical predicted protein, partial [Pelobates cultripes]
PFITVSLLVNKTTITTKALIDSGAADNLMDETFAKTAALNLIRKDTPLAVEAIDGRPLEKPLVTHETQEIVMSVGVLHKEKLTFQIIDSPTASIVLGFPG